jgi:uncharacterized phage protein (TIGR02220 family)
VAYSGTETHVHLILRQLRAGVTVEDLRAVIGYCAIEMGWKADQKLRRYLRPETLFGPQTISRYLDAARAWWRTLPEESRPPSTNGQSFQSDSWEEPEWFQPKMEEP